MLPKWMDQCPKASFAIGDAAASAYWRMLDREDFYTCVPDVMYLPDPVAVAAIHEFDPGMIPMLRKVLWLRPGGVEPFLSVHHVLARYVPDRRGAGAGFRVEMPLEPTHEAPNVIECVLKAPSPDEADGGPPAYRPFDMSVYHELVADDFSRRRTWKEWYDARVQAAAERKSKDEASREREGEYRQRHLDALASDVAEQYTYADYLALRAERRRRRKVFVDLGAR
jgi:hypothetical protein